MTHEQDIAAVEALEPRLLFSGNVMGGPLPGQSPITGGGGNSAPAVTQAEAGSMSPWDPDKVAVDLFADARATMLAPYANYMLFDEWGGAYADAEKSPTNSDDDLMCWAAAASNVLEWTGWGLAGGMTTSDEMFAYFQDHWTDDSGLAMYAWDWWFDGTNDSQGYLNVSQVTSVGGGFWPYEHFPSYFHFENDVTRTLPAVDEYLHNGYGVYLALRNGYMGGHAVTCWGVRTDLEDPTDYKGVWITDSDDDMDLDHPPDDLRYYDVTYRDGRWYLEGYDSFVSYYISSVSALEPPPGDEPAGADYYGEAWRDDPIGPERFIGGRYSKYADKLGAKTTTDVNAIELKSYEPIKATTFSKQLIGTQAALASAPGPGAGVDEPAPSADAIAAEMPLPDKGAGAEPATLSAPIGAEVLAIDTEELTRAFEGVERYMLRDDWGGEVADAEKSPDNAEDDYLMCWAAAASNVLDWTGWGNVAGMADTDEMFDYFKAHWANGGLIVEYAWDWWFDGTDDSPWLGLLQSWVATPGGGFYPGLDFHDYYHAEDDPALAMQAVDEFLHNGYGTTLGVRTPAGGGHAITCWGFTYDANDPTNYLGVWVTDSDDDMDDPTPRDRMQYYQVRRSGDRWQLVDFYGYDDWYISDVQALDRAPLVFAGQMNIELYSWRPDLDDPFQPTDPQPRPWDAKQSDAGQGYTTPLRLDRLAKPAEKTDARIDYYTFAAPGRTTASEPKAEAPLATALSPANRKQVPLAAFGAKLDNAPRVRL